jgi:hypothetical protein
VLQSDLQNGQQLYRRDQLHTLDRILADLEMLNLRDEPVPRTLSQRLRRAGVVHRREAPVSELIDLVFRAQEAFLQPLPITTTRRRSAA